LLLPATMPKRVRSPTASASDTACISWEAETLGSLSYLKRVATAVPSVGDDEVRVGVRAIGLNYADVFCALGLYEAANKMLEEQGGALCPGLEYAGEVLEVGCGVKSFKCGDRVYGFTRFGAYRTQVVVRHQLLQHTPEGWSDAEAAALLVQGITAWHGLVELGNAKAGSRVLVHSAAGGVGCAALEICGAIGAHAVAVVGSESKVPFLRERFPQNVTPLVRVGERNYAAQLAEPELAGLPALAPDGQYDVVLESLGGKYLTAALDRVAPMGRLVHFGATHAYGGESVDGFLKWLKLIPSFLSRPMVDPGKLVPKNAAIFGFNLIWLTEREDEMRRELEQMLTVGGLTKRPHAIGRTFPFAELVEALAWLRSGSSTGKVVVTVEPEDGEASLL
jgi:NADPH:quinone reductase-like Zn-dependent oxidoreductase